eukprot:COSAG01_NODE_21607_length_893_cov_67.313602_2_plen_128_part_00
MKRSVYTEVVEPRAIGQATVLSDATDDAGLKLDGIDMNAAANVPATTGSDQDATILAMKRRTAADIGAGNTDHVGNYVRPFAQPSTAQPAPQPETLTYSQPPTNPAEDAPPSGVSAAQHSHTNYRPL